MSKIYPLLNWYGGKSRLAHKIVPLFPPHQIYVEPFGGMAACLMQKPASPVEVYNDLNLSAVNLFRVIRDPDSARELQRMASLTPFSRYEWEYAYQLIQSGPQNMPDIEHAYYWYIYCSQIYGGAGKSQKSGWGKSISESTNGKHGSVYRYQHHISGMDAVSKRMLDVAIEHVDAIECIKGYDTKETLFYIDPPYDMVRDSTNKYHSVIDWDKLIDCILSLDGMVILSGYKRYDRLLDAGWNIIEFDHFVSAGNLRRMQQKHRSVETLTISPNARKAREGELFCD